MNMMSVQELLMCERNYQIFIRWNQILPTKQQLFDQIRETTHVYNHSTKHGRIIFSNTVNLAAS